MIRSLVDLFRSRHRKANRSSSLEYASIEARRLLAGIEFDASSGQILIGGTNGDDVARVSQSGSTISVTQQGFESKSFAASNVNSILFVGLRGDDFFENRTSIPSSAFGQVGNDTLIGGSGNDRLVGNGNEDTLIGNGGDDVLVAGIGNDRIDGGAGNDRILGINGTNEIEGGAGDDTIFGGNGIDRITDSGGNNLIAGHDGNDVITGGENSDNIFGGAGNDIIQGGAGDDRIYAQAGNDFVSGGSGNDIVGGNDGDDTLQGEGGNDRIVGSVGNDRVNFSGDLSSYEITEVEGDLRISDLRGPGFGLVDLVIDGERFSFADGIRTRDELVSSQPSDNARERIFVQPVIASNSNGTNTAEFFGSVVQQSDIFDRIDTIFAQADVDVEFLSPRLVNDTFVNIGNGGGTRPTSDLNRIVTEGDQNGLGSPDSRVVDMYFVERVPGFSNTSENVANGLAFIGISGIAMHVGDNLVSTSSGRAVVARVAAHEIGHNLGLSHVSGNNNLLSSSGSSTLLTQSQIDTIIASPITQPT